MTEPVSRPTTTPAAEPRWTIFGCLGLLLVGLLLAVGPKLSLSEWKVTPSGNTALAEALAWQRGTLDLGRDYYEDAEADGQHYNVVGLSFVLVSFLAAGLTGLSGASPEVFYAPYYVALIALPVPLVAFWAFRMVVNSAAWAAVLSFHLIAATSLLPVLSLCEGGSLYHVNHVLAVLGLLVFAAALLRERSILAAAGLALAVWSRPMTCLLALPLLWLAWKADGRGNRPFHGSMWHRRPACDPTAETVVPHQEAVPQQKDAAPPSSDEPADRPAPRRRNLAVALASVFFIAAPPMMLNALKFGNPFETGYTRLYEGRTDWIAERARRQFFGPQNLTMHAKAMNAAFPSWDIRKGTLHPATADIDGASIWLTTPLLLGVFITIPSWWKDPRRRALMLGTLPVILGLMCYHTTGSMGAGHYRYALDFIPIWLLVIAPYTQGRRGLPLTLACLGYSAMYFNLVTV